MKIVNFVNAGTKNKGNENIKKNADNIGCFKINIYDNEVNEIEFFPGSEYMVSRNEYFGIDGTLYNKELKKFLDTKNITDVYICGIDTECCVLKTALDLNITCIF